MLYKKPKDLRYVDMAIAIDEMAYSDHCDDQLMFEYLYHLSYMLAKKEGYFNSSAYYDDFAAYLATDVFLRIKNKKQFILNEDGEPQLEKIKSCLNYLRAVMYPRKVSFEQTVYSQIYTTDPDDDPSVAFEWDFKQKLFQSVDELSVKDFELCLGDIIQTSRAFLQRIPYKSDKIEWNNIYLSCMLSMLNSITINNRVKERIKNFKYDKRFLSKFIDKLYADEEMDSTILYHVDPEMKDYITILTRRLKHVIAKDLSLSLHTYIPTDLGMKDLLDQELNGDLITDEYVEDQRGSF